jgi:hypothetical protein
MNNTIRHRISVSGQVMRLECTSVVAKEMVQEICQDVAGSLLHVAHFMHFFALKFELLRANLHQSDDLCVTI